METVSARLVRATETTQGSYARGFIEIYMYGHRDLTGQGEWNAAGTYCNILCSSFRWLDSLPPGAEGVDPNPYGRSVNRIGRDSELSSFGSTSFPISTKMALTLACRSSRRILHCVVSYCIQGGDVLNSSEPNFDGQGLPMTTVEATD